MLKAILLYFHVWNFHLQACELCVRSKTMCARAVCVCLYALIYNTKLISWVRRTFCRRRRYTSQCLFCLRHLLLLFFCSPIQPTHQTNKKMEKKERVIALAQPPPTDEHISLMLTYNGRSSLSMAVCVCGDACLFRLFQCHSHTHRYSQRETHTERKKRKAKFTTIFFHLMPPVLYTNKAHKRTMNVSF